MRESSKPSVEFRISFAIASALLITTVILTVLVNINFVYVALLVAFGLGLTAFTGFCPMAFFIKMLFLKTSNSK
jgi:hypothetical protein